MTQPLGLGGCVSRAWHRVPEDLDPHSTSTSGALFPPGGAGASGLALTQRTRRTGRGELGQRPARTSPAQGSGRWGQSGRPAIAHVSRGHAASPPGSGRPRRERGGRRQLGPPGRPGLASARTAAHRRPHLPAHVQKRVIAFIVQLLLTQGRRHLRNLSPRQTGKAVLKRDRRSRSRRLGPVRPLHSGPWRPGVAPPPPSPEEARLRPAPPRGRGRDAALPALPRAVHGPKAQPGRRGGGLCLGWRGRLCGHTRGSSLSGHWGDRPLLHPLSPPPATRAGRIRIPNVAPPGPLRQHRPPTPRGRLLQAPLADLSQETYRMSCVPASWSLPFLLTTRNPAQRTGLLIFIFYYCPIFRGTWPFFCCLNEEAVAIGFLL